MAATVVINSLLRKLVFINVSWENAHSTVADEWGNAKITLTIFIKL